MWKSVTDWNDVGHWNLRLFSNHRDFLLIKFDFTVSSVYWYSVYCVYCVHIGGYGLVMRYVTQQACAGWEHGSQSVALLRISWIMGTQAASNYQCAQLKWLFLIDHKSLLEDCPVGSCLQKLDHVPPLPHLPVFLPCPPPSSSHPLSRALPIFSLPLLPSYYS